MTLTPHPYFECTQKLLGDAHFERLQQAHILVVGLGGVGSYAIEGLVRSGVGRLTLVDFDTLSASNINRQLHAMPSCFARPKVELMLERCRAIQPNMGLRGLRMRYQPDTSEAILDAPKEAPYSVVLDAIDQTQNKLHLIHHCMQRKLPLVSAMGAAGRLNPAAVRVDDLAYTEMDPFAKNIRRQLRRKFGWSFTSPTHVTAVYSTEIRNPQALAPRPSVITENQDNPYGQKTLGSAVFVTAVFGMHAAAAAVAKLAP
ncbi:MAG: tRNA threonylcarbamoyladenosine dehydratase [Cystobacterineae bacterium]|nr:tRNA threonylcarbamoyladenosine dehydratase [Cystobacterineae bacterium]